MESPLANFPDLNACVDFIVEITFNENKNGRDSQMRIKKNRDQVKVLENEYEKNPNWTKEFMNQLAEKVGLRESQVYKWHWDQRKKEAYELAQKSL
jgi:hypothetical protein